MYNNTLVTMLENYLNYGDDSYLIDLDNELEITSSDILEIFYGVLSVMHKFNEDNLTLSVRLKTVTSFALRYINNGVLL